MDIECWVHSWGEASEEKQDLLREALVRQGVKAEPFDVDTPGRPGACICGEITSELRDFIQAVSGAGRVIAIAES